MNHKVTLAVSAALMSMSVNSATQLSAAVTSSFDVGNNQLRAVQPTSVNKGVKSSNVAEKRTFIVEKGLEERDYTYIVQLDNDSVALYNGGIEGYPATNPKAKRSLEGGIAGAKLDINSPDVQRYGSYLEARQNSFIQRAENKLGTLDILDRYKFAVNGFSARMTPAEALELSRVPGVRLVERERMYELHTDRGPALVGAPGVWDGSAVDSGVGTLGEGVIVGIIDSGINTDHPSFADVADDGYDHVNPFGEGVYVGDCAGDFPEMCNDKLIGVRSYPSVTDVYADTTIFPARFTTKW